MNKITMGPPIDQTALEMAMHWANYDKMIFGSISDISFKLNPASIDIDNKYYVTSDDDIYEFDDPHDAWEWTKEINGSCQLIYPGGILVAYK